MCENSTPCSNTCSCEGNGECQCEPKTAAANLCLVCGEPVYEKEDCPNAACKKNQAMKMRKAAFDLPFKIGV